MPIDRPLHAGIHYHAGIRTYSPIEVFLIDIDSCNVAVHGFSLELILMLKICELSLEHKKDFPLHFLEVTKSWIIGF